MPCPFKEGGGRRRVSGGGRGEWKEERKCNFMNGKIKKEKKNELKKAVFPLGFHPCL